MVKPLILVLAAAFLGLAADPATFTRKLSKEQQIVHVLNRLTFGPRAVDLEEIRKLGVDKWIDLQLHPDRVPENPLLDTRLQPLETLRIAPAQILKDYPLAPFA